MNGSSDGNPGITERSRNEEALRLKTEQLETITNAMSAFLVKRDWHEASQLLLRGALRQTLSEYGFVGVLMDGPALRILAHEGMRWHEHENRSFYEQALQTYKQQGYLEFTSFENLFGKVLTTGAPVISNSPATDSRAGGLPPGHPPLRSFLGVPLLHGATVVGMIGVANRPDGYGEAQRAVLETLANTAAVLYDGYRRSVRENELTEQLRQIQKMEAIGQLAGGVAHDFNNILTVITGYCGLLLEEPGFSSPALDKIHSVHKAANRAAALTHRLLAFSRKQLLQPRIIDMNDVIRNMNGMLERLIREDIHITSFFAANLWTVKADPGQIEQVIMNLVINASDAMPSGGNLHIETGNVHLGEDFARQHVGSKTGPHVRLSVKDTGVGMDKDVLSHIFEPFFTTKKASEGTGLGLATVYGIVKQSGGYIAVQSTPQQGTVFDIYLPKAEGTPQSEEQPETLTAGGSETILLVEDDEAVRSLVMTALQSDGYKVLHASNGREADTIWNEHHDSISLVLTDVVMPVMSGPDLIRRIRTDHPHVKVVYMSGYVGDDLTHGEMRTQDVFIHKPFTPSLLKSKIRTVLDQKTGGRGMSA